MSELLNPAIAAFAAAVTDELVFGQVAIRRAGAGFELRHAEDRTSGENLTSLRPDQLRELAQFTASAVFRPLKSAPTLHRGWKAMIRNPSELELALNQIYPGAIADWYAAQTGTEGVTDFRRFVERQTGMYRITAMLSDEQAARVIRSGCERGVCLKRRLWSVAGLAADSASEKSAIPCLEPCALLLEFARRAVRLEQENQLALSLPASEATVLLHALRRAAMQPDDSIGDADFENPLNPRRIRLALERLEATLGPARNSADAGTNDDANV